MSTKQNTQKKGEKRYKKEGPKSSKKKKLQMRANHKGKKKKSRTQTPPPPPPIARNILDKKKVGTPKKTHSLEEPSPTITTQLKIEATYTCCNTIDTFYL